MDVEGFDLEGFGDRVRECRTKLRMTQEQLAVRVGVAATAVRRWEAGSLPRDTATLAKIAFVLEVSVSWLLGERRDKALLDGIRAGLDWLTNEIEEVTDRTKYRDEDFIGEIASGQGALIGRRNRDGGVTNRIGPPDPEPSKAKKDTYKRNVRPDDDEVSRTGA